MFSQGDVVSVDQSMTLHKVAAHFTNSWDSWSTSGEDDHVSCYEKLTDEILVPLNYNGKVKVLDSNVNTKYANVRELVSAFPRFAKTCQNVQVMTSDKIQLTVQAGTVIELDRTVPGERGVDKLVVSFNRAGRETFASIPLDTVCTFKQMPDENEYTIREVIERYANYKAILDIGGLVQNYCYTQGCCIVLHQTLDMV